MAVKLLHIFRNTPLGRETLLQSSYFCQKIDALPVIYLPVSTKFLMYFENSIAQVDLDDSYLLFPETAQKHATEIVESFGLTPGFIEPKDFTASTLPDIPINFNFMCCPRSISDLSSKIGLGYIGPRVRKIVNSAHFPVLITSPVYKPWKKIAVFFGGSKNAVNALKLGFYFARKTKMPIEIFTKIEKISKHDMENIIEKENLKKEFDSLEIKWNIFDKGSFEENLYSIPHDALVILGAYGHGLIKEIMFGSKMEIIQTVIPNNLLIAGPEYVSHNY